MLGEEIPQEIRVFPYGNIGASQINHILLRLCIAQWFSSELRNQTMSGSSTNRSDAVGHSSSVLAKYE